METQNFNSFQDPIEIQNVSSEVMSKTFMARVFSWMFVGLGVTAVVSFLFASVPNLRDMLFTTTGASPLFYVALFAPFALVLLMGMAMQRLSYPAMIGVFLLYSGLMGVSLSTIFLVYQWGSIFTVFLIAAGMFGAMALVGYTTHTDLTKFGSLMIMLLVGVIIASLVNVFIHSSSFDYMISFLCVAIFTGLTAYDVQKIKRIGGQINADGSTTGKMAIWGALSLYLDFVNLFLALLRIFGRRR
jgi:FtsH-binding integral membrane protein